LILAQRWANWTETEGLVVATTTTTTTTTTTVTRPCSSSLSLLRWEGAEAREATTRVVEQGPRRSALRSGSSRRPYLWVTVQLPGRDLPPGRSTGTQRQHQEGGRSRPPGPGHLGPRSGDHSRLPGPGSRAHATEAGTGARRDTWCPGTRCGTFRPRQCASSVDADRGG
jgi:hypothetical protein